MAGIIQRERAGHAAVLSFPDVEREAAALLAAARQEARQILAEADKRGRAEAARHEAEAMQRGQEEGRRTGHEQAQRDARQAALAEARERVTALTQALTAAVHEYDAKKHGLFSAAESGLIALSLAIAHRVCKTQSAASHEPAAANVRALLELVRHDGDLELHLNPAQCDLLAEAAETAAQEVGKAHHVRIVADTAITPGGCRLVAGEGHLDARIETQLDRIAACLTGISTEQALLPGGST